MHGLSQSAAQRRAQTVNVFGETKKARRGKSKSKRSSVVDDDDDEAGDDDEEEAENDTVMAFVCGNASVPVRVRARASVSFWAR